MINDTNSEPMFRFGVVEDIMDPLKVGRVRVRVTGIHTDNANILPTSDLPWATVLISTDNAPMSGLGKTPCILNGTWVIVSFMDTAKQKPMVWGAVAGIPGSKTNISPIDTGVLAELAANIPPIAPPKSIVSGSRVVEQPYIGSLTDSQVESIVSDQISRMPTSTQRADLVSEMKSNYTTLAGAGVLSIDVVPEKTSGILNCSHIWGVAPTIDFIQNGTDAVDANGLRISDSYKHGYYIILNVSTNEVPNEQNLTQAATDKTSSQQYQDARKYDAGTTTGVPTQGFKDPSGTYPLKDRLNESDINRLARGSNTSKTIVGKKEAARIQNVPVANGSSTWSQSPIPYATTYPYNQVMETSAGHVMEFDNTPGSERINIHHKAGTFNEIDATGNQVERIKGIRTIIVEKDELVYIKGSGHVNVDGDLSLRVKGNCNVEVFGDANLHVHGDFNQQIDGAWNVTANTISISAKSTAKIAAMSSMEIGSSGTFTVGGTGTMINTLGNLGAPIMMLAPSTPDNKTVPTYSPTITIPAPISRQEAVDMVLEDSPDITGPMYANAPAPTLVASNTTKPLDVVAVSGICGFTSLNAGIQLTTNYKLSDLIGTHPFPYKDGQHGLKAEEIACNLKQLAMNVLEPLRAKYSSLGFKINSCFREAGSNISTAKGISQHELGMAVDISFSAVRGQHDDRKQFYNLPGEIMNTVPFDQLLLEYRTGGSVWIHISFTTGTLRKKVLTMMNDKVYGTGLHLLV